MVVHNGTVRFQDKAGGTLTTMSLNNFWATVAGAGGTFDPKVLYDIDAGRWIIVACDDSRSATSGVLVGVSQSTDPTARWNLYKITIAAADSAWADHPSVGFNSKWIVVQVNMVVGTAFNRSHVYVFNKADLLAQGPASIPYFLDWHGRHTGALYR